MCVSIWLMRVIALFLGACFQVISTLSGDASLLTLPGIVSPTHRIQSSNMMPEFMPTAVGKEAAISLQRA